MPSDRAVALGVVATLVAFGAAIATLDVGAGPAGAARPGATAPAGVATRSPRQVLLTAAQALDDAGSARVRFDRRGPAGDASATGALSWGARDAAELETTDALGGGRLRMLDDVCYVVHDAPTAAAAAGGWVRADRAEVEALGPGGPAADGYAGGWMTALVANPGGRLHAVALAGRLSTVGPERLAGAGSAATEPAQGAGRPAVGDTAAQADGPEATGQSQPPGVAATRYRATVGVAELFGTDQNLEPPALSAVLAYYRALGVDSFDYDVWIGSDGRLLRMRESAPGRAGTEVTTTEVAEPGVAFEVQVPGPAEVDRIVEAAGAEPAG